MSDLSVEVLLNEYNKTKQKSEEYYYKYQEETKRMNELKQKLDRYDMNNELIKREKFCSQSLEFKLQKLPTINNDYNTSSQGSDKSIICSHSYLYKRVSSEAKVITEMDNWLLKYKIGKSIKIFYVRPRSAIKRIKFLMLSNYGLKCVNNMGESYIHQMEYHPSVEELFSLIETKAKNAKYFVTGKASNPGFCDDASYWYMKEKGSEYYSLFFFYLNRRWG
jgi:hypothetical protein